MKKVILVFATIAIVTCAYTQTDSTKKVSKPDVNNTSDSLVQNQEWNTQKDLNKDKDHDCNTSKDQDLNKSQNQESNKNQNQELDKNQTQSQNQDWNKSQNQSQNQDLNKSQDQNVQKDPVNKSYPDGVVMQNGKMMKVKNGQTTFLDKEMTMSNGAKITSDGTCVNKDGTKTMMKEGQHMDMAGNMIPTKTNKDKNMYHAPDSTATLQ